MWCLLKVSEWVNPEIELANLTDIFVLYCAPRSGDDLQAMKRE